MKTSFKKVLALVLAFAMVLSVCTMSFTASAEAADLSYYVMNDATADNGWENGSSVATRAYGDRSVYRIAPQSAITSQIGFKNDLGSLTADDLATVNTLSFYVKNETGAPLTYTYKYFTEHYNTEVEPREWLGADNAMFKDGYVYLIGTDEAEIVPIKLGSNGKLTLPAKFEGYVIYDLSDSANYGIASLSTKEKDEEGNIIYDTTKTVVDVIKASFPTMNMYVGNTEAMFTKAWYVDDIAISTKTVEELAKYLTNDDMVSYNFNMASSGSLDANESAVFWGNRYANLNTDDNGARPDIVDYDDGIDGKGLKFTVANRSGASIGGIVIRDSFVATRGTDLPFAIDKAVGMKYEVTTEGYHDVSLRIAGESNTIGGTRYFVFEDGTVMYEPGGIPANFKGTVYHIFDEKTIKGETTWADFINARTNDKLSLTPYVSVNGTSEGATITYGGFDFIYDAEPIVAAFAKEETKNPVVLDGNEFPHQWSNAAYSSFDQNWTVYGSKEITAVYKGTNTTRHWLVFNDSAINIELDAANVKGFSFKLKTPANGTTTLDIDMAGSNEQPFYGIMYAIDKYGEIVASVDAVKTGTSNNSKLTLPAGFEGIIVMDAAGEGAFCAGWNGATKYASYAEFYAAKKFKGVRLGLANSAGYVVGETTYVYDDLTVIYDTVEDYIADYQASCPEAESYMIYDGSKAPRNPYRNDWTMSYGDNYTAVFNGSYTGTGANQHFLRFDDSTTKQLDFDVTKVKGWSFKFKVPNDGYTHQFTMNMQWENADVYRGLMYAIDKGGKTVASRSYRWDGGVTLKLPSGFDGHIVLVDDVGTNHAYVKGYVGGGSETTYATFAEFYEARGGLYGFTFRMGLRLEADGKTTVPFEEGVSTYEYDDLKAVTQDMTTYMAELSAKLAAEFKANSEADAHNDGYIVNDLSGVNGNTAGIYSLGNANNVDISYGRNIKTRSVGANIVFNEYHPNGGQKDHNMAVVNKAGLDLSKIAGISYRLDINNPENVGVAWDYQINEQANSMKDIVAYAISDDGEITKFNGKVTFSKEFHGKLVVLFNTEGIAVSRAAWDNVTDPGDYTWKDFVSKFGFKNIRMWFNATGTLQMEDVQETNEDGETVTVSKLTGAYSEFLMKYDNLAVLYEDADILESIKESTDTTKYINAANSIASLGQYSSAVTYPAGAFDDTAPYDVEIAPMDNLPTGTAFKFTRNANAWVAGRQLFVGNYSTLTADEIKSLDALVYWVKVAEGEKLNLTRIIGGEGKTVQTSTLMYDTVKKEFTMVGGTDGANNVISGFEGYVIIPLKNAYIKDTKFSEAYGSIFTSLYPYFYFSNSWDGYTATEWYLGDVRAVKSLDDFYMEIGAETTPGDLNNDNETDLRDVVRLKKYNADPKTTIAYQNADVDGNGLVEAAAELIASKKQSIDVEYKAPEKDVSLVEYPDTFVGLYHSGYGDWDSIYGDVIAEDKILNMYSSTDFYTLAQLKEKGGNTWFYLSESYGGEPVFAKLDENGKKVYDREATEINEDYKTALDNAVKQLKSLGLWNVVLGFTDEEILMGDQTTGMTQAQFAIWTKYLTETYGKRFNACLSTYEVNGGTHKDKEGNSYVTTAANAETYKYVTDIGYDWYTGTLEQHQTMFNSLKTNIGDRTDIKYWFYPTAYSPVKTDGTLSWTDAYIAEQIGIFDTMFQSIPEAQRGGLYFYTWSDWSSSVGLESLIKTHGYTATRDALIAVASKYAK